ncbi:hypothetical protein MHY85_18540, partial [Cellulomonas sp. ACRRI]|nr:hypothetical protein [Cellulomonas sp. ACRRI]
MRRTSTARVAALLLVIALALVGVVAVAGGPAGASVSDGGPGTQRSGPDVPGTTTDEGQDAGTGAVPAPSPSPSPAGRRGP